MIWLIGVGGSIGAIARFLLGNWVQKSTENITSFPVGTWIINITGSFILGILTSLYLDNRIIEELWYFLGVGFCGAYTTFSTFGNEAFTLIQSNEEKKAIIYVVTSVIVGCIAAAGGFAIV